MIGIESLIKKEEYTMPRLQNIIAHIVNQMNPRTGSAGNDAMQILTFAAGLMSRSQELTQKDETTGLLPGEVQEMEQIAALYEKTLEFFEKGRSLKEALDREEKDRTEIRGAMREAETSASELDALYSQYKTAYPDSIPESAAGGFDTLWNTETFEDSQPVLDEISSYTRSQLTQRVTQAQNEEDELIDLDNVRRDLIDENAELEAAPILSLEDLQKKGMTNDGRLKTPISMNALSNQFRYAADNMRNKPSKEIISEEEFEVYEKLADELSDYATALEMIQEKRPETSPETIEKSLQKVATLPDFLGRRNQYNTKTNYQLLADVLHESQITSQNMLDSALVGTGEFLGLDMRIKALNTRYDFGEEISLMTPKSDPLKVNQVISLDPKGDLANELAKTSLRVEKHVQEPSKADVQKRAASIKKNGMFRQLAKDPERIQKILVEKDFSRTLQSFSSPFSTCSVEKKKEVLEKLKMFKEGENMDSRQNRSTKWCNLLDAIDAIDTSDPATYDQQLDNILNKTEIHMKGKKTVQSDDGVNRRFIQDVCVLGILAQAGPSARDRANILVDRTNYVRTRWGRTQPTISLDPKRLIPVGRINNDYNEIKVAEKDPFKRHELRNQWGFENYSLFKQQPNEDKNAEEPQNEIQI